MRKIKKESKYFQVIDKGIVLNFVEEPEGGYTVTVPSLPGCVSYGKTFEEAIIMIKDREPVFVVIIYRDDKINSGSQSKW